MTFEDLQKANSLIRTMNIKGKEYAEVNQRVKAFRSIYPEGQIIPELIKYADGEVVFKVIVGDGFGKTLSVGHAHEVVGSTMINKTSALENCETSAVGRALGFIGLGIDTSIASYEEVSNARLKQEGLKLASKEEKEGLMAQIEKKAEASGIDKDELLDIILEKVGFNRNKQPEGMTVEQYGKAMNILIGGK